MNFFNDMELFYLLRKQKEYYVLFDVIKSNISVLMLYVYFPIKAVR